MFPTSIEIAGNDNEGWGDTAFSEPKEETGDSNAVEARGSTQTHLNSTPRHDSRANKGDDRQATEQVCGWVFGDKLTEVKQ